MKITLPKESLVEQLAYIAGIIEKKQTSKILENVLILVTENKLQLIGTDLEIEMSTSLEIQADSIGQITAPAKKMLDICKALPDNCFVLIETDDTQRLILKGLRSRFELATLPADDFPVLDDIPLNYAITVPEKHFKLLLDNVSFSMAIQDVRYYLNGLLLDFNNNSLSAVATDGHRLALSTLDNQHINSETPISKRFIVPRKGIMELTRLLDASSETPIQIRLSDNHIRIEKGNIRFTSKLIDGKYPDYKAAIPANSAHVLVLDRIQFRETLTRVAILSNEKYRGIHISLYNNLMLLQSNNPENECAEEEIDIEYTDELFEIGFNVTYLLESINHLEDDIIKLELTSADSSVLVYSEQDTHTRYVVMPIRI